MVAGRRLPAGLLTLFALLGNDLARAFESRTPSESIGRPGAGRLRHGKRLPTSGPNFRAYSPLGAALGRTAVNDRVRDAVLEAYAGVARSARAPLRLWRDRLALRRALSPPPVTPEWNVG